MTRSCWVIEALAYIARVDGEPEHLLHDFVSRGSDLGLYAERGPAIGSVAWELPHALMHVVLIRAITAV